jgi:glycosyltransferase involved in cell wall biosynthesis
MRILQVLPHLSKGGAERVVVELSNSLIDAGHEVDLFLAFPVDPDLNQRSLNKMVRVQFMSPNSKNRIWLYLKLPYYVLSNLKAMRAYDVIHCHLTFGLVVGTFLSIFRKFSRTKKPRLIATCHVVGVGISSSRRVINERLSYFFDAFILMAQDTQWRHFISCKKRNNIYFVVNGISPSVWRNKRKLPSQNHIWKIGTISRLQRERKPWLFLEVFSQVNKLTNGQVLFVMGGDGPEKDNLKALSERMQFRGNLSMPGLIQDPKELLKCLDLYVGLNVEEVTGIAGLEAVFSGIPMVSIQLSPTYRNGVNDWIWSDQDPQIVAGEIVNLLENQNKLRGVAKDQYRVAIREYSTERMRDNYLKYYSTMQ